ncbi:tRNA 2-thiouridine(34) synthase MnmA [Pseudoflavonifractor capillosus]|uniref:tRNA 2-thiouridine(34) synthase MnmA n=1 Tax=Pseudoflavonifractor capillosus TaxID=106588 RepID=UPI001959EC33|nr:tRNA 2-thiouridine(34) synthase MnmA [Pseudoflavonifractor capillosus]MBM6694804.1 tRNA 2-thiouridine(34) synthase MnmA [Pseudoflavonifractor capillosus]
MADKKVVLGLSGGVDSAVAAQRLLGQGYEVHGLYLDIGLGGEQSARDNAAKLGIPLTVRSIQQELEEHVCAPFAADYLSGRTPIPCARCNRAVKFPALISFAREIGANWVATGHYARIGTGCDGGPILLRGNSANDQSYMLSRLTRDMLSHVLFPLGDGPKEQTRQEAEAGQLPAADRPDSMEICFIPDDDYAAWLDARGGTPPPGNFVDANGNVLGTHKGFHHYTIGQRRGLGVSSTGRLFVTEIRPHTNEVVLSHGEGLHAFMVHTDSLNWLGEHPLSAPMEVEVRLRHSRRQAPATILPLGGGRVDIHMKHPARAPTPGQLAVFYQGEQVLGSGWIR